MLTRKTPATLASNVTITGMGEDVSFDITFHNRTQAQIDAKLKELNKSERGKKDASWVNRELLLFIVNKMDTEYPLTNEGVAEMESDRPGLIVALFNHFHSKRLVELAKN